MIQSFTYLYVHIFYMNKLYTEVKQSCKSAVT